MPRAGVAAAEIRELAAPYLHERRVVYHTVKSAFRFVRCNESIRWIVGRLRVLPGMQSVVKGSPVFAFPLKLLVLAMRCKR